MLDEADKACTALLTPDRVQSIVALIPEEWLGNEEVFADNAAHRQAYAQFLNERIAHSQTFLNAAQDARQRLV